MEDLVRKFFWKHPEWWVIVLAVLGWCVIVPHAMAHRQHGIQMMMPFGDELLYWCVMVVAMMLPLMTEPLRWIAFQSFRQRRHRAMVLFVIGFLAPWAVLGLFVALLRAIAFMHEPLIAGGIFGLAAIWALFPVRTRALVAGHGSMPLAPSGWRADRDSLRFGLNVGSSCVSTCGLMMLACTLTGHDLVAMIGAAVVGAMERWSFRIPTRLVFAGTALLAIWFLLPVSRPAPPANKPMEMKMDMNMKM